MTEFVRDRVLTARRDETCPECRSLIPRGTRYTRESQRENGRTYNAILCQPCKAFAGRYLASMQLCSAINADEVTFHYGSLLDEAAEYLGHEPKPGQTLPDLRDILIAQFDACDVAERAEQARERALRQQAKERRPETTMAGVPGFPSARGMA